jgi:ABC-type nitrate/sulfonate/bicarbonate transport system substrate-binding protein
MEGKVLGVSKVGAISYLAPVFAMQKEGVDTKKVQYMAVGNDAVRGRALAAKTIAGAVLNGVNAMIALEAAPQLHIIYDVGSAFRDTAANTAVFARGEAISGKADVVAAAVKTLMEASRVLQSDKKAAVEQAIKTGLPAKAVQGTYDLLFNAPQPYYGVDGGVSEQAINSTAKLLKDNGDIDKLLTYKDIVEPRFVEQAMKELGPFKR